MYYKNDASKKDKVKVGLRLNLHPFKSVDHILEYQRKLRQMGMVSSAKTHEHDVQYCSNDKALGYTCCRFCFEATNWFPSCL